MKSRKRNAAVTRVIVGIAHDDLAVIDAAAAAAGETRSEFIRQAALGKSLPLRPLRGILAEASASLALLRLRYSGTRALTYWEHLQVELELPKLRRLVLMLIQFSDRTIQ